MSLCSLRRGGPALFDLKEKERERERGAFELVDTWIWSIASKQNYNFLQHLIGYFSIA
jgi:hypothetical protein